MKYLVTCAKARSYSAAASPLKSNSSVIHNARDYRVDCQGLQIRSTNSKQALMARRCHPAMSGICPLLRLKETYS